MTAAAPYDPADARGNFTEWLAREMPPGTVISDARWWAPKIIRAFHDYRTAAQAVTAAAPSLELPPLPEAAWTTDSHRGYGRPAYSAEQMHAYARAALQADPVAVGEVEAWAVFDDATGKIEGDLYRYEDEIDHGLLPGYSVRRLSLTATPPPAALQADRAAVAVVIETVGFVRQNADGDRYIAWTLEGGIDALEIGCELTATSEQVTNDEGYGEVYTAPPAAVPAGFVLVPVVPTDAMKRASCEAIGLQAGLLMTHHRVEKSYAAMLAAAPKPAECNYACGADPCAMHPKPTDEAPAKPILAERCDHGLRMDEGCQNYGCNRDEAPAKGDVSDDDEPCSECLQRGCNGECISGI